jgi:hypothetical protein
MKLRIALIEYYTGPMGTTIFLIKPSVPEPQIFEARRPADGQPVTDGDLLKLARRLLIDFNGLPEHWDLRSDAEDYRAALLLSPPVAGQKRNQQVREINLAKPAFRYDLTYWQDLSEALLPPKLKSAVSDCDLLCVVPHGPLHLLPFAALRWSNTEYLIEKIGLVMAPSATILRFCQYKNRARVKTVEHRPTSCFVAAVAAATDPDPSILQSDGGMLTSLFRQRGSHASVTTLIGGRPTPGGEPASKELIMRYIGGNDIVHLACHGVFANDFGSADPLESGLLVSDGVTPPPLGGLDKMTPEDRKPFLLAARDVFTLDLQADLVVLRACSSGRVEVRTGDELLGLSRAFFYAGTPSLLMTLWNVSQRSSRAMLDRFYRLWLRDKAPLPKWAALREAQLQTLRSADSHPYHWAPYILVGDWI